MARIVIGTRGSPLALWQARHVAALARAAHPGLEIEEKVLGSEGDERSDVPIARLGSQGVFVRRIERALIAGEIDVAVHSLKDLPSDQPTGLWVAAIPERHDARDAVVSREGWTLDEIPAGTVVGTGSVRRRSQLLHARPDLTFEPIRGNVDTRIGKLDGGHYGAVILALAGLERLGIAGVGVQPIDPRRCVPAVGQGALAIEIRMEDPDARALVEPLGHRPSETAISAERAFLRRLSAGCQAPATAYARIVQGRVLVEGVVGDVEGRTLLVESETGDPGAAAEIGRRLASRLAVAGGERILDAARDASNESG